MLLIATSDAYSPRTAAHPATIDHTPVALGTVAVVSATLATDWRTSNIIVVATGPARLAVSEVSTARTTQGRAAVVAYVQGIATTPACGT